jgi:hypothetical protein
MDPLVRESRPSTTIARPHLAKLGAGSVRLSARESDQAPNAAAYRATSSGVRSVPTCPRIPETLIIRVSDVEPADTIKDS